MGIQSCSLLLASLNCMCGKNLDLQLWLKMFSTNQITGFFDQESIDIVDFLHGVSDQEKVTSKTITFG